MSQRVKNPTVQEFRERLKEVQQGWTAKERAKRQVTPPVPYKLPRYTISEKTGTPEYLGPKGLS